MTFGAVIVSDVPEVMEIPLNCRPVAVDPLNFTAPEVETVLPTFAICMSQLLVALPVAPRPVTVMSPEVEVSDIGQTRRPRWLRYVLPFAVPRMVMFPVVVATAPVRLLFPSAIPACQ